MKKEWEIVTLEDVCEFVDRRGVTPEKLGSRFLSDGYRVISAKNIKGRQIDTSIGEQRFVDEPTYRRWMRSPLLADDVILTSEAPLGEPAYVDEEFAWCLGQRLFGIRTVKSRLHGRFLFYALQASPVRDDMLSRATGATAQGIRQAELKKIQLPLPSVVEQHRIVGILDEAFDGLATVTANAEQNLKNTRAVFESHLQSVFTQRGKGWVEKQLKEVLAVQPQNGWSPPAANHADSGTPVLTLSAVTGFVFRPDKIKFTSAVTDSRARYWVRNGDFLITRSNTPELVGHVAIASGIKKPTIYPDLIMRMNPDPTKVITEFLYYQMRTPELRKEITGRAQGANPTMKKVSNEAVRTLPICVPPISEQHRLVDQLDTLAVETQRLEAIYRQKLAALGELKKSLLHQAFNGKL